MNALVLFGAVVILGIFARTKWSLTTRQTSFHPVREVIASKIGEHQEALRVTRSYAFGLL